MTDFEQYLLQKLEEKDQLILSMQNTISSLNTTVDTMAVTIEELSQKIAALTEQIKKNSNNPPCQKAKNRYTERVGDSNFFCTSGENDGDEQKPIVFEIDEDGLQLKEDKAKAKTIIPPVRDTKPHYYG